MAPRQLLQTLLEDLLGTRNVYFQSPPSTGMIYPCIIYKLDYLKTEHASNHPYSLNKRYLVTSIDRNPDSATPGKIARLQSASFATRFVTDNLNHENYNLYF